jgi:NAD(P)-dependent dehydrogenase (short-subunit alcohol dehydrogenase family)
MSARVRLHAVVPREENCTMKTSGIPDPVPASLKEAFDLRGRVAVITGGAGLLGIKHAEAVAELGGFPVLVDIAGDAAQARAQEIAQRFGVRALGLSCNITLETAVKELNAQLIREFGRIDILINNAANNPKVEDTGKDVSHFSRLENFPLKMWNDDIAVGLTGAFLCSRTLGATMAAGGKGVILNISSDLGVMAPDQRLYRVDDGRPETEQPVKPVTYSVVKAGLIGLTRYLATYWPGKVRANALAPGGVYTSQPDEFVERIAALIPMGRMAHHDEYKGTIAFLVSDASSYMNGALVSVDGGRTTW